jgi:hypothetical protein
MKDFAVTTISALRQLIRTVPECRSVLHCTFEGRAMLRMLRPYLNERGDGDLSMPQEPVLSEVEEYFVAQRKLLDADFTKLHAEQDSFRKLQKDTRALIKAAITLSGVVDKHVTDDVQKYWGNL